MIRKALKDLKYDRKTLAVDILYDVIGCVLYGLGVINFAQSSNFAPGGVSGLALIVNHLTGFPVGVATVIINIPIVIICFKYLGFAFFVRSAKTILISALIVDTLAPHLPMYTGEPILAALFGGILAGAGLACIYMRDSSTGGSDFVILAVRKRNPQLSIGVISLVVDGVIILIGAVVYQSFDAALYGLIMTITYSLIIDKIMYGTDSRKLLIIVSSVGEKVSERILEDVNRGVTILNGKGGYTGVDKNVLLCACNKTEVFKIKRIVREVDSQSFTMVSSIDAAYGVGFKHPDSDT